MKINAQIKTQVLPLRTKNNEDISDDILEKSYKKYIDDDFIKNMTSKIQNQLRENNATDKTKKFFLNLLFNDLIETKDNNYGSYHSPYKNQFKFLRIAIMKYMNNNPLNKDICKNLEIFEEAIVKTTIYLKEALFHSIYDKIAEAQLCATDRKIAYTGFPKEEIMEKNRKITITDEEVMPYLKNIVIPILKNTSLIKKTLLNHHDEPKSIGMEREKITLISIKLEMSEESTKSDGYDNAGELDYLISHVYKKLNISLDVYHSYIERLGDLYSINKVIPTEFQYRDIIELENHRAEAGLDNFLHSR